MFNTVSADFLHFWLFGPFQIYFYFKNAAFLNINVRLGSFILKDAQWINKLRDAGALCVQRSAC